MVLKMNELFRAKIRKIGSSLGIIIPKEQMMAMSVSEGDEVEIALFKRRTSKAIEEGLGMAKEFKIPFKREKEDRY